MLLIKGGERYVADEQLNIPGSATSLIVDSAYATKFFSS